MKNFSTEQLSSSEAKKQCLNCTWICGLQKKKTDAAGFDWYKQHIPLMVGNSITGLNTHPLEKYAWVLAWGKWLDEVKCVISVALI